MQLNTIEFHREPKADTVASDEVVSRSPEMREVVDLARRIGKVGATVLITGESGSGKERIARMVHDASPRATGPFVAVNCGAISETLLETELFGHARGAFTGATSDRSGLFEAAHNGTLLLDEIGEISAGMQVKLLRVLQEHEIRRVGENRSRAVEVRVVSTTNRDLAQEVLHGGFRQDLYYRLRVVELHVPPLRRRRDDILPLATLMVAEATRRMRSPVTGFSDEVGLCLERWDWPGNVRELENAIEHAVALARGHRIELDDLPGDLRRGSAHGEPAAGAVRSLADVERDHILAVLAANGGNRTHTAEQLQIGSATLYRRLKLYALAGHIALDPEEPEILAQGDST